MFERMKNFIEDHGYDREELIYNNMEISRAFAEAYDCSISEAYYLIKDYLKETAEE